MARNFFHFRRREAPVPRPYRLPPDLRVYAVGDVHGRADCLARLDPRIRRFEEAHPRTGDALVIFLGDYIDRGPASRDVIEQLLTPRFAGLPARHLRGNHEEAVLRFLDDPSANADWLTFGGTATLVSYGVQDPGGGRDRLAALRRDFLARLPEAHRAFLTGLEMTIALGGFLFVHAGIRPGIPLAAQRRRDLLEIREPFLTDTSPGAWRVVHGHTVVDAPEILAGRIAIDTGAYATGRLSCVAIEADTVAILPG